MEIDRLTLRDDGAQLFRQALTSDRVQELKETLSHLPPNQAGLRLKGIEGLAPFLAPRGEVGSFAASVLGETCRPVRVVLFDKTAATNWALGWHQDRTIAVKARIPVDGFNTWSVKSGMQHVEPPFALLSGMVTLRVHIDPAPVSNAPLLIAPGSHKLGQIPEDKVRDVVRRCGTVACLADAGDIWLYATPILHASNAATAPMHRRVLQVDFAVGELPGGLEWLGV
ncbi:phytanoyl-CoA dioxygenase family protein [Bradyrhizobium sp. INPA01-394B]|uniref:Phytanoyl-CoA dioxygenase family protein n=1 Tax=Bradyrhizobium campsiandrae TaxID=1729892 RepID=A0ABR7UGU8_9BRAD|nr:phytanoyl-CoA dioxygenase family protein [Bradyrhizobium campsiandrae]MBC9881888.1 phytanoyl-CoA dioxygenase family protein [Bradyrhizobium campsiandrae]MBC9982694.1 phytanoyl-CoA dioxygenase family protein [Bradyrhizobium campsiandrae]